MTDAHALALLSRGRSPERGLTDREREVMRVVALSGGSSKEAARTLGLSVQTVHNVRSIAYARLGAGTLTEFYAAMGWLQVSA